MVVEGRLGAAFELGHDPVGQDLAELHAPLVEGVHVPDRPGREHGVLVEGHEAAEQPRREPLGQDHGARDVAGEGLVGHEILGHAVGADLGGGLAEGEGLGLGEAVGHQEVVVPAQGIERLEEAEKIAGNQPRALVDQLIEGVLAVGARLAPIDGAGLVVVDHPAAERDPLAVALHRELLEVGREPREILVIGQHRDRVGPEKGRVPDGDEPLEHRQVPREVGRAEVLVHRVEAGEQLAEPRRADGQHRGEADRRIHRVTAAHPVPEAEHVGRVDPEGGHLGGVGRDGHEVPGHRRGVTERGDRPGPGRASVGERLLGGEGLGRDDEQGLGGVEAVHGLGEVGAVHVGDEPEGEFPVGVMPQRRVGHDRAEIRAANPDIDDCSDPLARVPEPLPFADAVAEGGHPIEHRVHARHHVRAIERDRLRSWRPQRHVEHGPVFGDVDPLPREHAVDPWPQSAGFRQADQERQRGLGEPLLGVIHHEPAGFERELLGPVVIGGEPLPERQVAGGGGMLRDGPPFGQRGPAR